MVLCVAHMPVVTGPHEEGLIVAPFHVWPQSSIVGDCGTVVRLAPLRITASPGAMCVVKSLFVVHIHAHAQLTNFPHSQLPMLSARIAPLTTPACEP